MSGDVAQRYRKRPVEISAIQWDGTDESAETVMEWVRSQGGTIHDFREGYGVLSVVSLEGGMWTKPGSFIIRGVQNEFYPCAADIFEATYEPVVEP